MCEDTDIFWVATFTRSLSFQDFCLTCRRLGVKEALMNFVWISLRNHEAAMDWNTWKVASIWREFLHGNKKDLITLEAKRFKCVWGCVCAELLHMFDIKAGSWFVATCDISLLWKAWKGLSHLPLFTNLGRRTLNINLQIAANLTWSTQDKPNKHWAFMNRSEHSQHSPGQWTYSTNALCHFHSRSLNKITVLCHTLEAKSKISWYCQVPAI